MKAEPGDKVRLKTGVASGKRGVVQKAQSATLLVRLLESGEVVEVPLLAVTNYSLAARKAWQSMPQRRVGRPKGSSRTDRLSVTLRIDRELWERFKCAEETGVIEDRTAVINSWLSEKLDELKQTHLEASD